MNRMHALAAALVLALALPAAAQTAQDPKLKVLPPPGLNDPGVKAGEPDRSGQAPIERPVPYDQAPPETQSTPATSDAQGSKVSAANLPAMQDNGQVDGNGNAAPQVTVHTEGTDTVEEYRTAGRLTMIRVTPKNGVPYTVMANENGKLVRDSGTRNISPVYYKVYEWGAAPKPAGSD